MQHYEECKPLDKKELGSLMNSMFACNRVTGSEFKIEEYADEVVIITAVDKLSGINLK